MFTKKISSILKFGLLLVVLISLSLFLTGCVDVERLFTAGCVDMDVVIKIEDESGSGEVLLTLTTDSEESFEVLKDSFIEDSEDAEEEQDQVQTSIDEEGRYSLVVRDELSEGGFQVEVEGSHVVYTLEDIVLDLGGIIADEKIDEIVASCEGYCFSLRVNLPYSIQRAWWIDSENQKIGEVAVDHINDQSFRFKIPMATVLGQTQSEEWADRSGVVIRTEK